MQYKLENITPKKAKIMLKGNLRNRCLKPNHVKFLADQMVAGSWKENGQAIVMDLNDVLIDGQHRLNAIIQSEETIPMLVARGAAPEVMNSIDTGVSRGAGDVFGINGIKNSNSVASITLCLIAWDQEVLHASRSGSPWGRSEIKPSNDDTYKYHMKEAKDFQWAFSLAQSKRMGGISVTQAGCALMVLKRQYPKTKIEEFVEKIRHGGDYAKSPTHFLPGWIQKRKDTELKVHRYEQLFATLYCFERWMDGNKVQGLRINRVFNDNEHYYSKYNKVRATKREEQVDFLAEDEGYSE